jgi:1-aminocyclopropane-1-carboxylate synthase
MLSSRGATAARTQKKDLMFEVMADTYHPKTNPSGYINLGIAENTLMHTPLLSHLTKNFSPPTSSLSYGCGPSGSPRLRSALASFFNAHFSPVVPVTPAHIDASRGVTSSLERLAYELGDPGDSFLLGRPYYGSYASDLSDRAGVLLAPVSFGDVDPTSPACVAAYERVLLASRSAHAPGNGRITALLLCNPHNPLGRCYPRETLVALMGFCEKYALHLIVDEIYALSVFPNPHVTDASPFISALSIPKENLIDPARVHTLWGLSKDFGANSLRIGCVVSQENEALMGVLAAHAGHSFPSALLDYMACVILEDGRFVNGFLRESQRRLAENYAVTVGWLARNGIRYEEATAGCFVWADLGGSWRERRRTVGEVEEKERGIVGWDLGDKGWVYLRDEMDGATNLTDDVERRLVAERVYLASGDCCGSERAGWFRIVFSQPRGLLVEGLRRVVRALDN